MKPPGFSSLRARLVVAFVLLAVVPLLAVSVISYVTSQHALRRAVLAEADSLAAEVGQRMQTVTGEVSRRIGRLRDDRDDTDAASPFQKARREALLAAEKAEVQQIFHSVLTDIPRKPGEIPFAIDAGGKLYAPEAADVERLRPLLDTAQRRAHLADEWVVAVRRDTESGLAFGLAHPVGEALMDIRRTAALNLGLGLALVLVALLGILPLSSRMTRDLDVVAGAAERLGDGDLTVRVPVRSRDEFGRLAHTFNQMAQELAQNQARALQQERLHKELEMCRQIQEDLLPRRPLRLGFADVRGVSVPAREVGGDFFNYFPLGEEEAALLVGDVSGKGVPAALLMANLQARLRAQLPLQRDLTALVTDLDDSLETEGPHRAYVTLFVALLRDGELTYVNAGHNPPFLVRRDGGFEDLPATGRPVALFPGGGYEARSVPLERGDRLFLYTDGVVEAEDAQGEPFGMARLRELLTRGASSEPQELLASLEAAVLAHRGGTEAGDDATMVLLRIDA
jgi:serine phosphatase RsbU (regulator of sigma subunit)